MARNRSEKTRVLRHPNWRSAWIASAVEESGVWGVRLKVETERPGVTELTYWKRAPDYLAALKILADLPQCLWFNGDWVVHRAR